MASGERLGIGPSISSAGEWRQNWLVVLASMIGISIANLHVFSLGVMMGPLQDAFGWSRAQISGGMLVATVSAASFVPFIGKVIDEHGPRRVALIGIPAYGVAMAAFGAIGNSIWLYWALWCVVGFTWAMVSPIVWTAAVAPRFDRNRAMALAIALSGLGIGAALTPVAIGSAQEAFGWRAAYAITALAWVAVVFPLIFLFFERDRAAPSPLATASAKPKLSVIHELRSPILLRLVVAGWSMTFVVLGVNAHLVSILVEQPMGREEAVWIAGLIGLGSIVGRIGTGLLLDHFRDVKIAAGVFLLPLAGCALLIIANGSYPAALAAALLIGLALGGEFDVLAYLASRYFAPAELGSRFGWIMMACGIAGGLGPLAAGLARDIAGSYSFYLLGMLPISLLSGWLLAGLPSFAHRSMPPGERGHE